jgi:hypothetical protein
MEALCSHQVGVAVTPQTYNWEAHPTAVDRVRYNVWSYEICGGQSGTGAVSLRFLRFPLLQASSAEAGTVVA